MMVSIIKEAIGSLPIAGEFKWKATYGILLERKEKYSVCMINGKKTKLSNKTKVRAFGQFRTFGSLAIGQFFLSNGTKMKISKTRFVDLLWNVESLSKGYPVVALDVHNIQVTERVI